MTEDEGLNVNQGGVYPVSETAQHVRRNKGAPGVDGITVEDYPLWARQHWAATRRALEHGYYIPQPVRRVEIPKPTGGIRLLGVLTVNDRVVKTNDFGLSEYYRPLPGLDEWIRRRLRMCYLKQWRRPRTRIRNLIKLGTRTRTAVSLGLSYKGPYRLARTLATHSGMTNKWLEQQGLVSVREHWIAFHYA